MPPSLRVGDIGPGASRGHGMSERTIGHSAAAARSTGRGGAGSRGLLARAVGLALVFGVVGAGTAAAASPPVANATFVRVGAPVFAENAVGVQCRTLGFCDGVGDELMASSTKPRYRSTRVGEAVLVTCRSAGLAGVVGFFDGGDDVVPGWVDGGAVQLRQYDRLPGCGSLT